MSAHPNQPTSAEAPGRADLLASLPPAMRQASTVLTPIAAGMSGAGVYIVEHEDAQFVLKITHDDEPIAAWLGRLDIQRSAAAADIAPMVVHVDETRRAVLSERIVDRSFVAHLRHPDTGRAAITALGAMLRKRRAIPIPAKMDTAVPARAVVAMYDAIPRNVGLPTFVRHAINALREEPLPANEGELVMSHNDVNPTNLVYDGARVVLVDWQTAAPNDAMYDLAAIAMFLRLDDAACRLLIAAHDDMPIAAHADAHADALPVAFLYFRRCAALLSGVAAIRMAILRGHAGGECDLDAALSLSDVYQQLRSGTLDISTVNGQWTFGLALVKQGITS